MSHIHNWFELTYAKYLTLPRSLLQEMPEEWQLRFVTLLEEFENYFDGWRPKNGRYWVKLKDGNGKYVVDPFDDYRRSKWTPQRVRDLREKP